MSREITLSKVADTTKIKIVENDITDIFYSNSNRDYKKYATGIIIDADPSEKQLNNLKIDVSELTNNGIDFTGITTGEQLADKLADEKLFKIGGGLGTDTVTGSTIILAEITADVSILTIEAVNSIQPYNGVNNQVVTIPLNTFSIGDIVYIERLSTPALEFVGEISGVNQLIIRGERDADNRHFLRNTYTSGYLRFITPNEVMFVGAKKMGYSGSPAISLIDGVTPTTTAVLNVQGSGFSDNMTVSLTGNAVLNSFSVSDSYNMTIDITTMGSDSDLVVLTIDNGDITTYNIILQDVILNLIASYAFNGNLIDSANGNNGIGTGVSYEASPNNQALVLLGGANYVIIPNNTNLSFEAIPFTIEMDIMFSDLTAGYILVKSNVDTDKEYQVLLNNNILSLNLFDSLQGGRIGLVLPAGTFSIDTWYNIKLSHNGSASENGFIVEIDDVVTPYTGSVTNTYIQMRAGGNDVGIGTPTWSLGNAGFSFNGKVDNLKLSK